MDFRVPDRHLPVVVCWLTSLRTPTRFPRALPIPEKTGKATTRHRKHSHLRRKRRHGCGGAGGFLHCSRVIRKRNGQESATTRLVSCWRSLWRSRLPCCSAIASGLRSLALFGQRFLVAAGKLSRLGRRFTAIVPVNTPEILLFEAGVVVVEWRLLNYALPRHSKIRLLLLSLAMNGVSYLAGWLMPWA